MKSHPTDVVLLTFVTVFGARTGNALMDIQQLLGNASPQGSTATPSPGSARSGVFAHHMAQASLRPDAETSTDGKDEGARGVFGGISGHPFGSQAAANESTTRFAALRRGAWSEGPGAEATGLTASMAEIGDLPTEQLSSEETIQLLAQLATQLPADEREALLAQLTEQLSPEQREQLFAQLTAPRSDGEREALLAQLTEQLSPEQREQLFAQLTAQLSDDEREALLAQLNEQLSPEQREQLFAQLTAQLSDDEREALLAQLNEQLSPEQREQLFAPTTSARQLTAQLSRRR